MKKSPKQALEENAKEVRSWPPYLRTYSSAYFKWLERKNETKT